MVNETVEQKPQEPIEQRMKIELLHPINHAGILYSRGLHELDESLAKLFLSFKDAVNKRPIARVPGETAVVRGTTKPMK
jgi:hypothetical protein